MKIIAFSNLKGGVGKTTSCQNIAVALTKSGKRVAIVDMDPQSNLSAGFGLTLSSTDPQVFDLLSGAAEWDDILVSKEGIDIIPSSLSLVMAELNDEGPVSKTTALRDALAKIDPDRYDYMFLDSPPQLGIFTQNVLAACDKIIVPMDGGFYSLFGLRLLDRSLETFRERLNPGLEIGGILMTNYNPRLYISRKIYDEVRKQFGDLLFESYIRQNVSIVEASSMGMSIFDYAPKSKGAECYKEVADEFLRRLEGESTTNSATVSAPVTPPEPDPDSEPEPVDPEPEPEIVIDPEPDPEPEIIVDPDPEPEPEPVPAPKRVTTGTYEESIKQAVLDMLPESEKETWIKLLGSVSDVSRGEVDVRSLREDFEDSDKDRYTFYMLNDEADSFWPVMYPDQIIEPLRCVLKWDEQGSVEVFM